MRNYFYPADFSKRKLTSFVKKMKENELWQDEMVEHTDAYLDYIKGRRLPGQPALRGHREGSGLWWLRPGRFGTADCIIVGDGCLHIIDFKYGQEPGRPRDGRGQPRSSPCTPWGPTKPIRYCTRLNGLSWPSCSPASRTVSPSGNAL